MNQLYQRKMQVIKYEIQHRKGNNNSKKSNLFQEWKEKWIIIFQIIRMIRIKT